MGYILKKNLMVGSVIHICFDVYLTDFFGLDLKLWVVCKWVFLFFNFCEKSLDLFM
jgi:hypothetical protein